jgi:hypothetical protein
MSPLRPHRLKSSVPATEIRRQTVERDFTAEIYRCRGELLLHVGRQPEETATCFQQALAVARYEQAKSLVSVRR